MNQQRIVCTGDEAFSLEVRRLVLESFGYEAKVLPNCASASDALAKTHYDLAILDFANLTDAHIECIRTLRAAHPAQRMMLIAPIPFVDEQTSALVHCVLTKGASPEEFRQAVRACIGTEDTSGWRLFGAFIGTLLGTARIMFRRSKRASGAAPAAVPAKGLSPKLGRVRSAHM